MRSRRNCMKAKFTCELPEDLISRMNDAERRAGIAWPAEVQRMIEAKLRRMNLLASRKSTTRE